MLKKPIINIQINNKRKKINTPFPKEKIEKTEVATRSCGSKQTCTWFAKVLF